MAITTDTQQDMFSAVADPREERETSVSVMEAETSLEKIRSDLNLEKWSIWQPSKSKTQPKARVLRREVLLPDGSKIAAEVKVGFTDEGVLTTEDQKTFYALLKIWEDKGRPAEQTFYSSRGLAKVLHKGWGTNVIESNSQSLMRLRITPFIWKNSYHDSARKKVIEELNPFSILSDLKIIRTAVDGRVTKEYGYFKFNDFILNNLLHNHTKPLLLDVVLGFKSELAQMLYTHLDLIMARRNHYERKTKELFDDLGLEGEIEYRYPSGRKRQLEKALKELKGAHLTTGTITTATLEKTKDDKDYKLVIRKSTRTFLPLAEHTHRTPGSWGAVVLETQPAAANDELTTQAKELVAHFHKRFHNTEASYPTSKAINQGIALIAHHGLDQAHHLVDFSYHAAQETRYAPQTFGGILQYTSRALAAFEDAKRKQLEQTVVKDCTFCDRNGWVHFNAPESQGTSMRCPHNPETIQAIEQRNGWRVDIRMAI